MGKSLLVGTDRGGRTRFEAAEMDPLGNHFHPRLDQTRPVRLISEVVTNAGDFLPGNRYTRLLMERTDIDLTQVMLLDRVQKGQSIDRDDHKRLKAAGLVEGRYPNLIVADSVAKATGERAGTSGNGGSTSSTI